MDETIERRAEHFGRDDRDLLVELRTEIAGIKSDIKDIKDGTTVTLADHEMRLRKEEAFRNLIIGGLILTNVVILPVIFYLLFKH